MLTQFKPIIAKCTEGLGSFLGRRLHLAPNQVSLIGFLLGLGGCAFYYFTRHGFLFVVWILAAGLFDALDGAVARATGRASRFGSYLDAMLDRYFEIMVAVTVAAVTGYWFWTAVFISGALLVSYAKARAAMEVPVSNNEWPDFMERAERDLIFIAGFAISEGWRVTIGGRPIFFWTLVFLSIATHATVLQRVLRAKKLIVTREGRR